jgi:hypothetical protein
MNPTRKVEVLNQKPTTRAERLDEFVERREPRREMLQQQPGMDEVEVAVERICADVMDAHLDVRPVATDKGAHI